MFTTCVEVEKRLLTLHLLLKQVERKDFSWSKSSLASSSALDDVGSDVYRYRYAGLAAVSLADQAGHSGSRW
jgi:hypothetical protein